MNVRKLAAGSIASLVLAIGLPSCVVDTFDGAVIVEPTQTGALTILASVEGTTDPGACAFFGASFLELIVYDPFGRPFVEAQAPCEDFVLSVELPEGDYSADVTLVDDFDRPVSLTLPLDALRVIPGTELAVNVDFPTGSIL